MQIEWKPRNIKPTDRETCSIYVERGWATPVIVVGVTYYEELLGFIDPFGSPESATTYLLSKVSAWVNARSIQEPPDAFFGDNPL